MRAQTYTQKYLITTQALGDYTHANTYAHNACTNTYKRKHAHPCTDILYWRTHEHVETQLCNMHAHTQRHA